MWKCSGLLLLSLVPACGATANPVDVEGLLEGAGGDPGVGAWPDGVGGSVASANGGSPGTGGYGTGGSTPLGTGGLGTGGVGTGGSGTGGVPCGFPFPCPTGGAGGVGMGGTPGAAGAGTGAMSGFRPDATNPKECPAAAPNDPWGPCAGLPIYLNCKYSDGTRPYACVCDWIHWICI